MESPIDRYLRSLHAEISELDAGTPYAVVPPGTRGDPKDFGICVATVDGYVYEVGTTRKEFSIHSISKPFTYGLALADLGIEAVDAKIDVEPSGDAFNEISLAPGTGRPANAMINAGAIAAASLIKGSGGRSAMKRILGLYSDLAGRPLRPSRRVFDVEMRHSDGNHALAYLLSSFGIIETDPTAALETYLRQCAVQVTCRDLSLMAATLANNGTNPVTGRQVMDLAVVERVLSVMLTSGMYDDAGSWVADVGMPAKSGVGGGVIAVLPGQVGLAVFSPSLDRHGGSVRGIAACRRLAQDLELHFVRAARAGRSAIRAAYPVAEAHSDIRRSEEAAEVLRANGDRAWVIALGGDLFFAGTESVVREISRLDSTVELVVLDVRRVDEMSGIAFTMFRRLRDQLAESGRSLVVVESSGIVSAHLQGVASFPTRTAAVEHCEEELLSRYGADLPVRASAAVEDSTALASLAPEDVAALVALMESRSYDDGATVRRVGQRFGGVYFIISGRISSFAVDANGDRVRLSTLGAGMTFGELSLGSEDRQEITVKADGPVEVKLLTAAAISQLEREDPRLAMELWRALTRDAYARVDQYLREAARHVRD